MEFLDVYSSDKTKIVNVKFKLPLLLSILPLASMSYLIWWDKLGVYSGVYEIERITDYVAMTAFGLLALSCILSFILSFSNRAHLIALLPALIFGIYRSRILHGQKRMGWNDCDMSICDDLELYQDGTYYYKSSNQLETKTRSGKYLVQSDTLYLDPNKEEQSRLINDPSVLKKKGILHVKSKEIRTIYENRIFIK
ncbi:MAG TPA: hypothetical protein DIW47_10820 [Bacteroidetes bacterium]|nr:hypothetical protein [Bacteroidota bacterium]